MKQVYLYGISGADKQYRVVRWYCIEEEVFSMKWIKYQADLLRVRNPDIEHVYAIDNRRGLRSDYQESIKKNTIESCAIFKDILEREGVKIF